MDAGEGSSRRQTYQLRGKVPYVAVSDRFIGEASILAGTPRRCARPDTYLRKTYHPLTQLDADDTVDRYAAVKSLPFRPDLRKAAVSAIEQRLDVEPDERVLLEAAGAGSALGSAKAIERVQTLLWTQPRPDLRMEAVLILTELHSPEAHRLLLRVATDPRFALDEIRQAAVWGLGKAGLKQYDDLVPFIADQDRDVALHALAGFGPDTEVQVVDRLIGELHSSDVGRAPAASEALRIIGNDAVLSRLIQAARAGSNVEPWILATLGRLPAEKVRSALRGDPLLDRLAPLLLISDGANWIADDTIDIDLKFLLKQNL